MAGITWTGLDELEQELKEMEITTAKEEKILRKAGDMFLKEIKSNTPEKEGFIKKSIKKKLLKTNEARAIQVYIGAWDAKFVEYGTSKSKAHVNFFGGSVEDVEDDVFKYVEKEVFGDEK